jgi:hypothetical protein
MNIYIDKPNLLSIVHSVKKENYSDCMRMLKENFRLFFTFSKQDIENLEQDDKKDVKLWFAQMTTGIKSGDKKSDAWESDFPARPLDISKFNSQQLSSVYCLSRDSDPKMQARIQDGGLIIACEGQEIEVLSSLFFDSFQFTKDIFDEVSSWADMGKYMSPCTDVVITDQYLLSSPEIYQQNIYSLLHILGSKSNNSKVNVIIFTLKSNYNKETKTDFVPDWDEIYTKIRSCAGKHSSFNVTFVTASKETIEEHDRTIFTNYKMFASGDTYNYFNSNGEKITKGRWLHVHSTAIKNNESKAVKFLQDMQSIIGEIEKKGNDKLIIKDKISNFLTFSK